MREFLTELYLLHGDKKFTRDEENDGLLKYKIPVEMGYISYNFLDRPFPFQLTPKGLEYLKNA